MDKSENGKIQASKGHSLAGEHRQMDKSRHEINLSKQGALTDWRVQMDRQVRTWKESKQVNGTHQLKSADGWTSQDTERIWASNGHSLAGECKQMDKLGHRKNPRKQGALTNWRAQMDRHVRTQKESKQARGSLARECRQTDSPVRTWKESKQVRGTHKLESTDGQTSQDTERI